MPKRLVSPTGRPIELSPAHANAGVHANYRKRIDRLVDEMDRSLIYWLSSAYRNSGVVVAMDATPANEMRDAMRKMAKRWQKKFDQGAKDLAAWFAQSAGARSDAVLDAALKKAGFTVPFTMTASMRNAYDAVIGEQVGLIRSIASQHLTRVETLVMQSVAQGRKLDVLTKQLAEAYDVTKRRAALIARDQNNKATATFNRTRRLDLGITHARWKHSAAGKVPRPSHVKANGEIYEIAKGMYLDGKWTWPGHEINCRCFDTPVIPGF